MNPNLTQNEKIELQTELEKISKIDDTQIEILSSIIFKRWITKNISYSDNKKCFIIGGQPGACKSTIKNLVSEELNNNVYLIDTDKYRSAHPFYKDIIEISQKLGKNSSEFTHSFASKVNLSIIQHALKAGYNIILENTFTTPKSNRELIQKMSNNGYDVYAVLVGVDKETSMLSVKRRYENALGNGDPTARDVPIIAQIEAIDQIPTTIFEIIRLEELRYFELLERGGNQIIPRIDLNTLKDREAFALLAHQISKNILNNEADLLFQRIEKMNEFLNNKDNYKDNPTEEQNITMYKDRVEDKKEEILDAIILEDDNTLPVSFEELDKIETLPIEIKHSIPLLEFKNQKNLPDLTGLPNYHPKHNQVIRDELDKRYGKDALYVDPDDIIDDYNEYAKENLLPTVRDMNDLLQTGQGGRFLEFLEKTPKAKGVYKTDFSPYDIFMNSYENQTYSIYSNPFKVENRIIAFNKETIDKLYGDVGIKLDSLKNLSEGKIDTIIGDKIYPSFNFAEIIDKFYGYDYRSERFKEDMRAKMLEFYEYARSTIGEEAVSSLGFEDNTEQSVIERLICLSRQMVTSSIDDEDRLLKEFSLNMKKLKDIHKELVWLIKNEITNGYCLNTNLENVYGMDRIVRTIHGLKPSNEFNKTFAKDLGTLVVENEKIKPIVDDKIEEYKSLGYQDAVNYLNSRDMKRHKHTLKTKYVLDKINFTESVNELRGMFTGNTEVLNNVDLITKFGDLLVKVNNPNPKERVSDDIYELINVFNTITSLDRAYIPSISFKNPDGSVKTKDDWVTKEDDMRIMESIFISRLAELNVLHVDMEQRYSTIKREMEHLMIDIEPYRTLIEKSDMNVIDKNRSKISIPSFITFLELRRDELNSQLNKNLNVTKELDLIDSKKESILLKSKYYQLREEVSKEATDFIFENLEKIKENISLGRLATEGIELKSEMFFSDTEIKEIVSELQDASVEDKIIKEYSDLRKEYFKHNRYLIYDDEGNISYHDDEDEVLDKYGNGSSYSGGYITPFALALSSSSNNKIIDDLVKSRLDQLDPEDRKEAAERIKNEVVRELEDIKELKKRLEDLRVKFEEANSAQVKEISDEIKEDIQKDLDKRFNDSVRAISNRYGFITEQIINELEINIDGIDDKRVDEILEYSEAMGILDNVNRDAGKIKLTKTHIQNDMMEVYYLTSIENNHNQTEKELIKYLADGYSLNPDQEMSKSVIHQSVSSKFDKIKSDFDIDYKEAGVKDDRFTKFYESINNPSDNFETLYNNELLKQKELERLNSDSVKAEILEIDELLSKYRGVLAQNTSTLENIVKESNELYPIRDFSRMSLEDMYDFLTNNDPYVDKGLKDKLNSLNDLMNDKFLNQGVKHIGVDKSIFKKTSIRELSDYLDENDTFTSVFKTIKRRHEAIKELFNPQSGYMDSLRERAFNKHSAYLNWFDNITRNGILNSQRDMFNPVKVLKHILVGYTAMFILGSMIFQVQGKAAKDSLDTLLTGARARQSDLGLVDRVSKIPIGEEAIKKVRSLVREGLVDGALSVDDFITPDASVHLKEAKRMVGDIFPNIEFASGARIDDLNGEYNAYTPGVMLNKINEHIKSIENRLEYLDLYEPSNPKEAMDIDKAKIAYSKIGNVLLNYEIALKNNPNIGREVMLELEQQHYDLLFTPLDELNIATVSNKILADNNPSFNLEGNQRVAKLEKNYAKMEKTMDYLFESLGNININEDPSLNARIEGIIRNATSKTAKRYQADNPYINGSSIDYGKLIEDLSTHLQKVKSVYSKSTKEISSYNVNLLGKKNQGNTLYEQKVAEAGDRHTMSQNNKIREDIERRGSEHIKRVEYFLSLAISGFGIENIENLNIQNKEVLRRIAGKKSGSSFGNKQQYSDYGIY